MPKQVGTAIIFSGPSGSGKSVVIKHLLSKFPETHFSVSCATRQPRQGEINGKDYFFITMQEYMAKVEAGLFLEHAEVHGNGYGTLNSEVLDYVSKGKNVILDIDVQGAMRIKQLCRADSELEKSIEFVFLAPPSYKVLEKRLRGRGTETEEVIQRRLANALDEIRYIPEYSYLIVNDVLEITLCEAETLFRAFAFSAKRRNFIFQ